MNESQRYLPAITIKKDFLFPQVLKLFTIGKELSITALNVITKNNTNEVIMLFQKNDNINPSILDFYPIGLLTQVTRTLIQKDPTNPDKISWVVELVGLSCINLESLVLKEVEIDDFKQQYFECGFSVNPPILISNTEENLNYIHYIKEMCKQYVSINYIKPDMYNDILQSDNSFFVAICYYLVSIVVKNNKDLVPIALDLLNSTNDLEILKISYDILSKEFVSYQIRQEMNVKVQTETHNLNRELLLRQQLKYIQDQLNESGDNDNASLEGKLKAVVPEDIFNNIVAKEVKKLSRLSHLSADHQVIRTYLEVLSELPWTKISVDNYGLMNARKILDDDHYGLDKIKERIIEFIAVKSFAPLAKSPILCLVGAPGVGKTSLGQSIARALDRKFQRIALGGLHDEAELRGHRRTYIGSLPGKIIEAVRRAGTKNPLILLDEIDKIGNHYKGDPAAALLEILDPEQNKTFTDHYIDIPFDLSNVLFLCTANSLDTIAAPLLDRMEIIPLSSYTETEKVFIAQKHLIPKQLKEVNLDSKYFSLSEELIRYIIFNYAPEAGVRRLEQLIDKLIRKVIVKLKDINFNEKIIKKTKPNLINLNNIRSFLGIERPFDRNKREELRIGNSVGLGWSHIGGSVLYIEALINGSSKDLIRTGSIGESMSESVQIALSYIRGNAKRYGLDTSLVKTDGIHIHFPEGAVKKDGPSAGIAITTALFSLFSEKTMRSDTAMTGEITLSGLVLPIGGLKEKSIAAMKAGLKRVIIPKANEPDLSEFPDELKKAIEFIPVSSIDEVLQQAFEGFHSVSLFPNNLGNVYNNLSSPRSTNPNN